MRGLGRFVLEERPELAPADGPVDQRDLANGDAAEADSHRQRDDVQAIENVRQWLHGLHTAALCKQVPAGGFHTQRGSS